MYFLRMKKVLDHNRGKVKMAIALTSSHKKWKQRTGENIQQKKQPLKEKTIQWNNAPKKKTTIDNKDDISEEQRKMIANFKFDLYFQYIKNTKD